MKQQRACNAGGLLQIALLLLVAAHIAAVTGSIHKRRVKSSRLTIRARWKSYKQRVAILNDIGFHNEVYVALLWGLTRGGQTVDVFVHTQSSWHIESTISDWYHKPFREAAEFWQTPCDYEVVALPTFPEHHMEVLRNLTELKCPRRPRIVAVVHNPGVLLNKQGYPDLMTYVAQLKPHLLALAPHTVEATRSAVRRQAMTTPVSLFVPVFPIHTPAGPCPVPAPDRQGFVLQGLFESHRRNYSNLFSEILANASLMSNPAFRLHLIGRGSVDIPASLSKVVIKEESLPYEEYYARLQKALAVVPGFARDTYYKSKASSSVAAALICCTPLIANRDLMNAYTYLNEEVVYMKEGNETDAEAMARIQSLPESVVSGRGAALEQLRQHLFAQNQAVLDTILRAPPIVSDRVVPQTLNPEPPSDDELQEGDS